ncbi:CPBP family intramembrane glutamic endopeptidase [Serinibacter salmoneus]|uniref:CAAX prenyl protease 2/Lysostaphin resistance protein A-like domain-containing protein n=1 Tax=Serinibacter salmoneus TaxID=556530 RepID=A0A2A9CXA4_9MICO|nr:CPBP family intramembrane glutamic endopeptidase [Serinibacter salmoneus]PFG18771.1 hypothetical protein ATL40_0314 [Serinibacter salmoneus]
MRAAISEIGRFLDAALITRAPGAVPSGGRGVRRRLVVTITLVLGAVLLWWALRIEPGDPAFYAATLALAALWVLGAFASGPLHLGHSTTRSGGEPGRAVVQSLVLGTGLLGIFLVGAVAVAQMPWLRQNVLDLLDHAGEGRWWIVLLVTAVNGVAEEIFFRGAAYAALPARIAVPGSAVLYALSTVGAGVPLLTFAALVLGAVTALQRRVTGGVLGPIITHVIWSGGMLLLLPLVL